jgi:hypothetical protein
MALFSDVDWIIVAVAAAFLLFGKDSAGTLRTLGRWYGRAGALKQELLTEFAKAAEIPVPAGGGALTVRGALLGLDPAATHTPGIPAAVTTAPRFTAAEVAPTPGPWTAGYPVPTWSTTMPGETSTWQVSR